MKVYLSSDLLPCGGIQHLGYTREAAIRLSRESAKDSYQVRTFGDQRTDDEALEDFIIVRWAVGLEVME
jgi:hypothetical protein